MISLVISFLRLKRLLPAALVAALGLGVWWLWESRASALEDLRNAQNDIQRVKVMLEAEQQRRTDVEQIAEERRKRDLTIEKATGECLDTALPEDLWELSE